MFQFIWPFNAFFLHPENEWERERENIFLPLIFEWHMRHGHWVCAHIQKVSYLIIKCYKRTKCPANINNNFSSLFSGMSAIFFFFSICFFFHSFLFVLSSQCLFFGAFLSFFFLLRSKCVGCEKVFRILL